MWKDNDMLSNILHRNQGQVLTPELIAGIVLAMQQEERLVTGEPPMTLPTGYTPTLPLRPSNKRLVLDDHPRVAAFVAQQTDSDMNWVGYFGLGLEQDGELVAGVIIESYTGRNANIHVAGIGKHWLNRNYLAVVFDFCFNRLGLQRLTGLVEAGNTAALRFDTHLGFKHEHTMPDGGRHGDLHILCMRREDCRYLPNEVQ